MSSSLPTRSEQENRAGQTRPNHSLARGGESWGSDAPPTSKPQFVLFECNQHSCQAPQHRWSWAHRLKGEDAQKTNACQERAATPLHGHSSMESLMGFTKT